MENIIAIKQLSRAEKLRVMEAIWEDLSSEDQSIQSPAWHESVLKETEQRVQAKQEKILDWKKAKKELRQ
ncbi:MAG: addiction module protein, partial [Nitrospirales bacterium]